MPAFVRSIRFRLTVWYSSLLLVFGVAFVLALNIAVFIAMAFLQQTDKAGHERLLQLFWLQLRLRFQQR